MGGSEPGIDFERIPGLALRSTEFGSIGKVIIDMSAYRRYKFRGDWSDTSQCMASCSLR